MVELIIAKLRTNRAYGLTGFYYTKKDGEQDYKVIVTKEDKGYYQALDDVEAQLVDNDIVEVVKCKDCVHLVKSDPGHPDCDYCERLICGTVQPDFFCAAGKRKRGEKDAEIH